MKFSLLCLAFVIAGPLAAADDLETSYQKLREALPGKDAAVIKKLAVDTSAQARATLTQAKPGADDSYGVDAWTKAQAYAKEVDAFTEYALYSAAVGAAPAVSLDLFQTLEQQNPRSKYLDAGYRYYFVAMTQTGAGAKIPALAEKAIGNWPENEDLLLVLADTYLGRKQLGRAGQMAERLVGVMQRHQKPEDMAAADWERKKALALGHGYWIAGLAHMEANDHYAANADLRAALPFIKESKDMMPSALFNLGLANYYLGRASLNRSQLLEASKFSEQCAQYPGALQQQAWTNAHLMKTEADKLVARK